MLSLFEGYLLIFVALFAVNIGLFLGNFKTNNLKAIIVAVLSGILLIGVNSISGYFKDSLSFLAGNFGYLFIVAAAVLFVLTWIFLKKENNLTEEMKNTNQLYWVGMMNNFKNEAEEIVLKELIYV